MYPFIETLCIKNATIRNLPLHNYRCNATRLHHFNSSNLLNIEDFLPKGELDPVKTYKFRVEYLENVQKVELIPYTLKTINTFSVVEKSDFSYRYKSSNREVLNSLLEGIKTDEVIIAQNNYITDTSYSNLIFFDGKNWVTPSTYLLNGTMRQYLLSKGKIVEKSITINDLPDFSSFKLINAMMSLEESPIHNIGKVIF